MYFPVFSHLSYSESASLSFNGPPALDYISCYDYSSDSDLGYDTDNESENFEEVDAHEDDDEIGREEITLKNYQIRQDNDKDYDEHVRERDDGAGRT
jgi:hypothetical protein